MSARRYTKDHEWIIVDGDIATVGITDFAQEQLGDVVFVDLPAIGKEVTKGGEAAVVESVKAASEVYAPIAGTVVAVNDGLAGEPAKVNAEPFGGGWFMKLKVKDPSELDGLLDEAAYRAFVAESH
ncbi:MAG: glycine cleavage system protein GcvH [Alphaproteobacteria bacterium]|nr:glycine cleavage system protein GcvH [Alphaproteobacteria bacterium]